MEGRQEQKTENLDEAFGTMLEMLSEVRKCYQEMNQMFIGLLESSPEMQRRWDGYCVEAGCRGICGAGTWKTQDLVSAGEEEEKKREEEPERQEEERQAPDGKNQQETKQQKRRDQQARAELCRS